MREFKKPNILISSCIGDCKCRYDGSNAKSEFVEKLEPFVNFTDVCPEADTGRNINMSLHLFGYFSKDVSKDEKAFFLDNLDDYSNNRIPFSVPLSLLKSWIIRFENEYLMKQTIFESFPQILTDVRDSGKSV